MKSLRPFLCCCIALLLSACATTDKMAEVMPAWKGRNVNDLVAAWGKPAHVANDDKGGQIYTYYDTREDVQYRSPDSATVPGRTQGVVGDNSRDTEIRDSSGITVPPNVFTSFNERRFWIDGSGTIYRLAWRSPETLTRRSRMQTIE